MTKSEFLQELQRREEARDAEGVLALAAAHLRRLTPELSEAEYVSLCGGTLEWAVMSVAARQWDAERAARAARKLGPEQ